VEILVGLLLVWALLAYLVLPALWRHHEHQPGLAHAPLVTRTPQGIPGDPLNVALLGTEPQVDAALVAAGWSAAATLGLRASVGIVESVVLARSDPTAPVSTLLLWDRPQDLAYERQEGRSAKMRHHVRFWRSDALIGGPQPLWLGAATFDRGVGLSHRTGQVTHHIAAAIDAERDALVAALAATGWVARQYQVTGVGATVVGRNGGGDRYFTDGELTVAELRAAPLPGAGSPEVLPSPAVVRAKNGVFAWLRRWL
jgi:hypothetical protein